MVCNVLYQILYHTLLPKTPKWGFEFHSPNNSSTLITLKPFRCNCTILLIIGTQMQHANILPIFPDFIHINRVFDISYPCMTFTFIFNLYPIFSL